jgi:hypothetical protein
LQAGGVGGGGGCAGSEYGDGVSIPTPPPTSPGSSEESSVVTAGNAIGGVGIDTTGGPGNWLSNLGAPADLAYTPWFYSYELIGGSGGNGGFWVAPNPVGPTPGQIITAAPGGFLSGGGGGETRLPTQAPPSQQSGASDGAPGGYGGGGGGRGYEYPTTINIAGTGGVGVVIVYYKL